MSANATVTGQMTWRPPGTSGCNLHLRYHPEEPWRFYKEFPEQAQPDIPEFSEGYATFMALLKAGWEVVSV